MDESILKGMVRKVLTDKLDTILSEMRMAPDQSGYPLTRRQVERMLSQYERREDEDNWNDNPEYRSSDGWAKARWYPPELSSDFSIEDKDNTGSQRPAKLMPYDYFYTNMKDSDKNLPNYETVTDDDDMEHETDTQDWSGETNHMW